VTAENRKSNTQITKDVTRTMPNDEFMGSDEGREVAALRHGDSTAQYLSCFLRCFAESCSPTPSETTRWATARV